jgi:hypothetical protein
MSRTCVRGRVLAPRFGRLSHGIAVLLSRTSGRSRISVGHSGIRVHIQCTLHPTAPFHPTSHHPRDLTFTRIRLDAGTRRQDQMYTDSSILYRVSQDTAVFTICDKRRHDSGPWRGSCLVGALSACFEDGETRRRSV